jgi:DeoR/GlpR family transcriptional regulator of sugar metabolism
MLTDSRHSAILRRVQETGSASVSDLARLVDVSESTIRRDLNALNGRGLLRRVRGGGAGMNQHGQPDHMVHPEKSGPGAAPSAASRPAAAPAPGSSSEQRIAVRAAELVRDGDVVVLDIGTTAALIARALRGRAVTVITASVAVLDELRDDPATELILLGGMLRRSCHSLAGSLTEDALRSLRATICFLGTSGVQPDGSVMDTTGTEVPVKQALLAAAPHIVLAADETKFPGTGIRPVASAGAFTTLITSIHSDPPTLELFRQAGSDVITV